MTVAPVYLVLGEDTTLRNDAVRALIAQVIGNDDPTLAVEEFTLSGRSGGDEAAGDDGAGEGPGSVLSAALNAASTPPFGSDRRVIVLRDAGALVTADAEALIRWLADPLPTTILVVVAGGGRMPATIPKAVKAAGGKEVRTGSEKTGDALAAGLRAAGITLTPAAGRRVAEWFGEDAGRVPALVDLLRSVYGEGVTLDTDDVEPYLGASGSVPAFHLTGAIDRGEVDVALEVLHRLRGAGFHPLQVMVLLHRHYQRLLRLDSPAVETEAQAVDALGGKVKAYPASLALRQARALGSSGIRAAYRLLAKADLDLRGASAAPDDAVLEVLVARLAGLSRRAGAGRGRSTRSR